MKSILNINVSVWRNYFTTTDPQTVSLLTWVSSDKYRGKVELIRSLEDKAARDRIKATLPAITPGGIFDRREAGGLIMASGLLQFDIDPKGNPSGMTWEAAKARIASLNFVGYCGLSVSGRGVWGLVPIAFPDRYKDHFKAIYGVFAGMGLLLDEGVSSVASLRGYSWDPEPVINHNPETFTRIFEPPPAPLYPKQGSKPKPIQQETDVEEIISRMIQRAADGEKHPKVLRAARLAAGLGWALKKTEDVIMRSLDGKSVLCEASAKKTIRDGYNYGKDNPISQNQ